MLFRIFYYYIYCKINILLIFIYDHCGQYNKALFFHCASCRLNLVINDLNKVMVARSTAGTITEIIKFYHEENLYQIFHFFMKHDFI